jgi:F0F1-type ATP synthase delta subunit
VAGETKANIEVVEHLSPELIGGIIIKYEDYMLDASILHSINEMKRKLIDNTYQISF